MPRNVNGYGVALNGTLYRSGLGTKKVRVNDLGTKMLALSRVRNIQRYGSNTRLGAYMPLPVINLPLFFRYIHQAGLLADSRTLYFGNLIFCLVAGELLHQSESTLLTLQSNTLPASLW